MKNLIEKLQIEITKYTQFQAHEKHQRNMKRNINDKLKFQTIIK